VACLAVYALLLAPWPGLMDGYRYLFRTGGNLLFQRFGGNASVSFQPLSSADHTKDTTLVLTKHRPYMRGEMDIKSVYVGYRPTAFLVALVLATPIPWSRRWRALALGLVLVNVFVALRLTLHILDGFSENSPLALFHPSPFWKGMLKVCLKIVVLTPAVHYIGPAFIWLLVTFRRGDLADVLAGRKQPAKVRRSR
jgi:hypothetical protein